MLQNNANLDKTNFDRFYQWPSFVVSLFFSISGNLESTPGFLSFTHTVYNYYVYIFVFWKSEWLDYSSKPTMLMHNTFISHYIPVNYMYAGKNAQRQILPSGHVTTSSVHVRARELSLRIDHFSWFIVTFFRKLFRLQTIQNHIEICCYSLLPTCIPLGRKVTLTVQIYKATKGMREVAETLIIQ